MPKKLGSVDKSVLVNAALPAATSTYTVISHNFAITTILQKLSNYGFQVKSEEYRCTHGAKIALGTFIVNYGDDPELEMTYSFANSYDKSLRFRSAIGARVLVNGAYMIRNADYWKRKHTGTAKEETEELIERHIKNAQRYFEQLKNDKTAMQNIEITRQRFGRIIGELFLEGFLTVDQMSLIQKEYENPSFAYSGGQNNLWTCYNHVIYALKKSHPTKWMQNQASVHLFFSSEFDLEQFDTPEEDTEQVVHDTSVSEDVTTEETEGLELLPGFEISTVEESLKMNPNQETEMEVKEVETDEIQYINDQPTTKQTEDDSAEDVQEDIKAADADIDNKDDEPAVAEAELPFEEDSDPVDTENANEEKTQQELSDSDEVYILAEGYEGININDIFEEENSYYQVLRKEKVDGVEYLVCKGPLTEESEKMTDVEPEVEEDEKEVALTQTESETTVPPEKDVEQEVEPDPLGDDTRPEKPVDMPDVLDDTDNNPVRNVIADELEEIYGEAGNFTYTVVNRQYNVVLESGESIVFSTSYIDGKLKN